MAATTKTVVQKLSLFRGHKNYAEDQVFDAGTDGLAINVKSIDFLLVVFPAFSPAVALTFKADNIAAMTNEQLIQNLSISIATAGAAIIDVRGLFYIKPILDVADSGTLRFSGQGS